MSTPLAQRFWPKVHLGAPDECWPWKGSKDGCGYGVIAAPHTRPVRYKLQAHRVAWQFANGPIAVGMSVLHRCDNRACVNPAHLFLGTQRDNMRDMDAKGRRRGGRGVRHWCAKLTEAQVIEIRRRYAAGEQQIKLAPEYGVTQAAIHYVVAKGGWRHVREES